MEPIERIKRAKADFIPPHTPERYPDPAIIRSAVANMGKSEPKAPKGPRPICKVCGEPIGFCKTTKTITQWFEQAKSEGYEWADKAIQNYDGILEGAKNLSWALAVAFDWEKTDGFEFWDNIANNLKMRGL